MHVATLRERIVYGVVLKEAASFSLYKKNNPRIKRIMYTCRSEYACMKDEKEERERIARAVTNMMGK